MMSNKGSSFFIRGSSAHRFRHIEYPSSIIILTFEGGRPRFKGIWRAVGYPVHILYAHVEPIPNHTRYYILAMVKNKLIIWLSTVLCTGGLMADKVFFHHLGNSQSAIGFVRGSPSATTTPSGAPTSPPARLCYHNRSSHPRYMRLLFHPLLFSLKFSLALLRLPFRLPSGRYAVRLAPPIVAGLYSFPGFSS